MTKKSKTKDKATPVATHVESEAEEPRKSKKAKRDHHGKK